MSQYDPQPREGYKLTSPAKQQEIAARKLRVLSVGDDYLVCNPVDDQGEAIDVTIYVVRPYTLQRSPWDGQTDASGISYVYTGNAARTATRGTVSEDQLITPDYNTNDIIYAELTPETWFLSNGKQTRLMDANRDGRAWAHLDGP